MNHKSKPIQAVFGKSVFLRYRIYVVLGVGSVLINIFLSFIDLILFLMNGIMLFTHLSEYYLDEDDLEKLGNTGFFARKEFEFIYQSNYLTPG